MKKRLLMAGSLSALLWGLLSAGQEGEIDSASKGDDSVVELGGKVDYNLLSDSEKRETRLQVHHSLHRTFRSYLEKAEGNYRIALADWKESNAEAFQFLEETRNEQGKEHEKRFPYVDLPDSKQVVPQGATAEEARVLGDLEAQFEEALAARSKVNSGLGSKSNELRLQRLRQLRDVRKEILEKRSQIRDRRLLAEEFVEPPNPEEKEDPELEEIKNLRSSSLSSSERYQRIRELMAQRSQRLSELRKLREENESEDHPQTELSK